jgi:hypothetical protein
MSQQDAQPTSETLSMTLELIADEQSGDPALAIAVGRDIVASLQHDGYAVHPVYKGQMGGIFVEVVTTITQMATMAWNNRAIADEAIADLSGLVIIFGSILPALKKVLHAHEQRVGKEESVANPIKISLMIDGAPLSVEAPDVTQADAALKLAQQFRAAHSTSAPRVTTKSKVAAQVRVPTPKRKRRR